MLASELRDSASARDHTMTELYHARLEADKLRVSLADAQAECQRMESQLDRMRSTAQNEVVSLLCLSLAMSGDSEAGRGKMFLSHLLLSQGVGTSEEMTPSMMVVSEAEAELQREVEELKLRLHMAAEHYKEKYRECQRLRRQVAKLNAMESQGVSRAELMRLEILHPGRFMPKSAANISIYNLFFCRSQREMYPLKRHRSQ